MSCPEEVASELVLGDSARAEDQLLAEDIFGDAELEEWNLPPQADSEKMVLVEEMKEQQDKNNENEEKEKKEKEEKREKEEQEDLAMGEGEDEEEDDEDDEEEEEEDAEDDEEEEEGGDLDQMVEDESDDESYAPPAGGGAGETRFSSEERDPNGKVKKLALGGRPTSSARRRRKEAQLALSSILRGEPQVFFAALLQRPKLLVSSDLLGRTALHLALLRSRPEVVKAILSVEDKELVARALATPFLGAGQSFKDCLPPLHLALAGLPFEQASVASLECLRLLLSQPGVNSNQVDNSGRSALHLACATGSTPAVNLLLERGADAGLVDDYSCLPLHYAIDSRSLPCVQRLLEASDPSLFAGELHPFYRCIDRQAWEAALLLHMKGWPIPEADINRLFDFAAARGLTSEWNFVCEKGVEGGCKLEELVWPPEVFSPVSTAVVTHPVCLLHGAIPGDIDDPSLRQQLIRTTPDNPHRLEVLCGEKGVLRSELFRELSWFTEPKPAPLVDVLRVHEFWYIHKLMERVRQASLSDDPYRKVSLDGGDTKVTTESWNAALRAAGCVLEAVDQVCNEQVRNAFCAVRPPGHHMGPAGATNKQDLLDDPEGSQGFCLLNNVSVAAAYARCVYRHVIHRVAIVDFDVHHGNGTEATVRNLKPRDAGRREAQDISMGGFSARIVAEPPPTCKPWLDPESDPESVFFASIHGYGGGFYPGTGASCSQSAPRIINVALRPDASSHDFREGLRTQILPDLQAFDPDLIIISAGFDGHEDDLIGNCRLAEEDYIWATQQLLAVANRCCQGRVVSVLEGGYNTRAEVLSPFAMSVASHVRTLMHTSQNYSFLDYEAGAAEKLHAQNRTEARQARAKRRRSGELEEADAAPAAKAVKLEAGDASPSAAAASPDSDLTTDPIGAEAQAVLEAAAAFEAEVRLAECDTPEVDGGVAGAAAEVAGGGGDAA